MGSTDKEPVQAGSALSGICRAIFAALLVGAAVLLAQGVGDRFIALLVAAAFLLFGGLIGFLFGIPKVLQGDDTPAPARTPTGEGADSPTEAQRPAYRLAVNTNLEQISDWLTKIIVGFGLIELRRLPAAIQTLAQSVAKGLSSSPSYERAAVTLVLGTVVYFALLGFLGSYLLTRLYLASAFRKADEDVVTVGGRSMTTSEAVAVQSKVVADLLDDLSNLSPSISGVGSASQKAPATDSPKNILWVDDNPSNNSYIIDQLQRSGIVVEIATSTEEGLKALASQRFDWLVTDMVRKEGAINNLYAGIEFIRRVRATGVMTPIVVHSGHDALQRSGADARSAGAFEVTDSSIRILSLLRSAPPILRAGELTSRETG